MYEYILMNTYSYAYSIMQMLGLMIHQLQRPQSYPLFSLLLCPQKGDARMNQNKAKLSDCFKTGQGRWIENIGQNLVLASDTVTDLLEFFSFIFWSKILGLCYRKMKSYLDS